ncbi:MAG: hypothetical protein U1F26_11365 [Lysobacterales bacterium]
MEQLQLEYQVMNRGWMNATAVNALTTLLPTPWDLMITGARVASIMRSAQPDSGFGPIPAPSICRATRLTTPSRLLRRYMRVAYEANAVIRARVRPAPAI